MSGPLRDVLVVDDEPVDGDAARRILTADGLLVDVARDAAGAVERGRAWAYGVVLCDLKMPGVRGLELVRHLQELQPQAPLVTITGYATVDNAMAGFAGGIFDFIPKPFDVGELLGVVHRGLDCAREAAVGSRDWRAAPLLPAELRHGAAWLLGAHAWVVLDAEGVAHVGMGSSFAGLSEPLAEVELPAVGEELAQGGRCVRLVTASELVQRVWSPLSGRVLSTHATALSAAAGGPLITMLPTQPEVELTHLTPLSAAAGAQRG